MDHPQTPPLPSRTQRWRLLLWGGALALLLTPLVAMQFTREVNWTGSDFAVFAILLAVACGGYELATRMNGDRRYRAAAALAVLNGFLLVWANLAVGVIGSEANPFNLVFFAILAMGAVAAVVVRFRAPALVGVLCTMAAAHLPAAWLAYQIGTPLEAGLTLGFAVPWLISATLMNRVE